MSPIRRTCHGNDCLGGRHQKNRMTGRQRAAGPDEARPGLGPPGEASLWQVARAYGGRRSAGRSVERDSANEDVARQRAERRKGPLPVGQTWPPGSGRELTRLGSGPSAGRHGQWCARRRSRRQARAERRCGGRSPSPSDEARIGPGAQCSAHSCGVGRIAKLRAQNRSRRQRRRHTKGRATYGRAQPFPAGRSPGRAGSPLVWGSAPCRPAQPKAR